jgi:hypothetical protein
MPIDLPTSLAAAPNIIGAVGGTVGIATGVAVFLRRRLRLRVAIVRNSDAHETWHTVNIADKSDLAIAYTDFALGWHVMTPFGRLFLGWAYSPEEERPISTIAPHSTATLKVYDQSWEQAWPPERRANAYLRLYLNIPSRGRGVWLPVHENKWNEYSLRERVLRRMYWRPHPDPFESMQNLSKNDS